MISIKNVSKIYQGGFQALSNINLEISKGEIFALLGPNGAGKTTLIGIICGLVNLSEGEIQIDGYDIIRSFRQVRRQVGLVPQELTTEAFETVWDTVSFSRGLFGLPKSPKTIEKILGDLSLLDKKNSKIMALSGGMKRRVMIAKALSHEPKVLFLDEPTAGVDVELRRSMWDLVRNLRGQGVTIILTTHYIEEAEEMADRVGVISQGKILLVEEKSQLMAKLGKKEIRIDLRSPLAEIPSEFKGKPIVLSANRDQVIYTYDSQNSDNAIADVLKFIQVSGVECRDLHTHQSSLEDIFVELVRDTRQENPL